MLLCCGASFAEGKAHSADWLRKHAEQAQIVNGIYFVRVYTYMK